MEITITSPYPYVRLFAEIINYHSLIWNTNITHAVILSELC